MQREAAERREAAQRREVDKREAEREAKQAAAEAYRAADAERLAEEEAILQQMDVEAATSTAYQVCQCSSDRPPPSQVPASRATSLWVTVRQPSFRPIRWCQQGGQTGR